MEEEVGMVDKKRIPPENDIFTVIRKVRHYKKEGLPPNAEMLLVSYLTRT